MALPVLPGAASTTSGPPRRAPSWRICCSSDRHTGTPCCTRSGLVAHVDFGLAFDLRRREFSFERAPSSCRSRSAVGGWRSAAPLLQSCSDGVPLSRLVGRDCAALHGWRQHSPGVRASGLQTGYGRCSLEVRKRLHTALRQARGRLRSEPGGRHVRRVPLSRTDQLRMTHTCCSAQVGSAFSSFGGGRDEDAVCAACLSAVAGLFE